VKRLLSISLIFFTSLLIGGCGTTPNKEETKLAKPVLVRSGLAPQNLDSGECGLFIWTTDKTRTFIGFETSNIAKLFLNGQTQAVTREREGELTARERTYKLANGETVPLSLEPGTDLKGGEGFSGQIVTKTSDGWDRVTPIVALASCVP